MRRLGVVPGHDPSADEEGEPAAVVKVGGRRGARIDEKGGQGIVRGALEAAATVV